LYDGIDAASVNAPGAVTTAASATDSAAEGAARNAVCVEVLYAGKAVAADLRWGFKSCSERHEIKIRRDTRRMTSLVRVESDIFAITTIPL